MIAVIQRVTSASVWPKSEPDKAVSINRGLFVLIGVANDDSITDAQKLATKISKLRILADKQDKMNLDIKESGLEILLVSQFTLLADTSSGNRPSFIKAAKEDLALPMFNQLNANLLSLGINTKLGYFGQYMELSCSLDGPTTIILDTKAKDK